MSADLPLVSVPPAGVEPARTQLRDGVPFLSASRAITVRMPLPSEFSHGGPLVLDPRAEALACAVSRTLVSRLQLPAAG
jgi:hypothetical protein